MVSIANTRHRQVIWESSPQSSLHHFLPFLARWQRVASARVLVDVHRHEDWDKHYTCWNSLAIHSVTQHTTQFSWSSVSGHPEGLVCT